MQVGTTKGGVSAFAVVTVEQGMDPPPAAAPVGASFPQPATLRAVPLGVAVPPGLSPVAMLAAQTLCAADVPSLQHPRGGSAAAAGGPGADEEAEADEEKPWRDAFPGQPLGDGGAAQVIAVRLPLRSFIHSFMTGHGHSASGKPSHNPHCRRTTLTAQPSVSLSTVPCTSRPRL